MIDVALGANRGSDVNLASGVSSPVDVENLQYGTETSSARLDRAQRHSRGADGGGVAFGVRSVDDGTERCVM